MKMPQKLICCTAIAVVLGAGVTVASAAQASNGNAEQYISDTPGEPTLPESSIEVSEPETAAPEVSDSTADNTEERVIPEETESAPDDKTEESAQPEAVKRYLPVSNAPEDIDYCSTEDFVPTECWNGTVIIYTDMRSEVYAVSGGEVIFTDYAGGAGNTIIIKYENGLFGCYYHLDFDGGILVDKGDIVETGQLIGLTGISGNTVEPCFSYLCCEALPSSFLVNYPELSVF